MRARSCCDIASSDSAREPFEAHVVKTDPQQPASAHRSLDVARWMIPGAILVLLPKCPMCLAAYIAIGIGVGLSPSAATYLRMLLITLCVASLLYLVAGHVRRFTGLGFSAKAHRRLGLGRLKHSLE